jgi:cell division inhibitor SepF
VAAKPATVSPTSFNDVQQMADRFMAKQPVIVNLQGVEADLSRRIIDFASGICYGGVGQMERITHQVYLLTPSDVKVSDEDRRHLAD